MEHIGFMNIIEVLYNEINQINSSDKAKIDYRTLYFNQISNTREVFISNCYMYFVITIT